MNCSYKRRKRINQANKQIKWQLKSIKDQNKQFTAEKRFKCAQFMYGSVLPSIQVERFLGIVLFVLKLTIWANTFWLHQTFKMFGNKQINMNMTSCVNALSCIKTFFMLFCYRNQLENDIHSKIVHFTPVACMKIACMNWMETHELYKEQSVDVSLSVHFSLYWHFYCQPIDAIIFTWQIQWNWIGSSGKELQWKATKPNTNTTDIRHHIADE